MAGEVLLKMMNSQGGKDSNYSDVLYGTVTAVNPVEVLVGNNMPLPSSMIEIGRFGKPRSVFINGLSVNVDGTNHAVSGNAAITESLSVGDSVSLLRGHGGQRFYILDRV